MAVLSLLSKYLPPEASKANPRRRPCPNRAGAPRQAPRGALLGPRCLRREVFGKQRERGEDRLGTSL